MAHWSYSSSGRDGPAHWGELGYPDANGNHQSPVAIDTSKTVPDSNLRGLEIQFNKDSAKTITNNGHTVQVDFDCTAGTLKGGPLDRDEYKLAQFHFHWGSKNSQGSEHKINGKTYAAELHLVHWNKSKYSNCDEAKKQDDGLCVLTVFIEPGNQHEGLKKIVQLLPDVVEAGKCVPIIGGFNPDCLLPDDKQHYWTYKGSLTTPPCTESVRFIIFRRPIQVSTCQLEEFRKLNCAAHDSACHHLVDNFRPIQQLNDRKVKASFGRDEL